MKEFTIISIKQGSSGGIEVLKTVAAHGLVNGRGPLEEWEGFSFQNLYTAGAPTTKYMEKNTESTRQLKVAKEIQKHMAEIIRSKGMAAFGGALVSVSGVKISPDLSFAKVYVSIFPSDKAEAVMSVLEENTRALRGELGAKVAKQLRITPEIVFCLDSSLDYVEHIEELLKK